MQGTGSQETNWPPEPRPLAPPLGRPPPPPPPTRPLAPPLSRHPPPPPPPRPAPSSHLPPPFPHTHPPPPLPTSHPPPLPSSTSHPPPPLPPPPSTDQTPLPPQPEKQDSKTQDSTPSSEEHTSSEKSPTSDSAGFEGMKFKKASGILLGKRPPGGAISMKLGASKLVPDAKKSKPVVQKPALVSQAFGNDSDEEEEMPPEAKLRMRNVGKDTPTSSGPNSFYKGKAGFSDPRSGYKRYNEDD